MKRSGFAGLLSLLVMAWGLTACGSASSGVAGGSPTPSPSVFAARPLIVIPENSGTGPPSNKVDLVSTDGRQKAVLTVRQDSTLLAATGAYVFVVAQHSGGLLKGVTADGAEVTLGNIGTDSPNNFMASPDGKRWLWGVSSVDGQADSSAVEEGGIGLSSTILAKETSITRGVMPYAWTKVSATIEDVPNGIGGYIPFVAAFAGVRRLDPDSLRLTPVTTPAGCNFSDLAADGTIACVTERNDRPSITIVPPSGAPRVIPLSLPRFTLMGDAYFSPDGRLLTVAGAEGIPMQASGGPERFGLDLITVADGSIRRFGPDGLRPSEQLGAASWLPDGSLVLWRPAGAAGGDPGTYVLAPDGGAVKISAYGPPIGVMTS